MSSLLYAVALTLVWTVVLPGPAARADWVRDRLWHLDSLDMAAAWSITQGAGITVAVIDSGVDGSHPDLVGNVAAGVNFGGPGDGNAIRTDHGTAMAGLIAAHGHDPDPRGPDSPGPESRSPESRSPETRSPDTRGPARNGPAGSEPGEHGADGLLGIAPQATILPVSHNGNVSAAAAVRWAVDNGADVINCSFGTALGVHDPGIRDAVAYALANDVVVVASAGNTGSAVGFPGGYSGVIGVVGLTRTDTSTSISAHGPEVDLAAPAEGLMSTEPGGGYLSIGGGTSGAAAITSGVVALVRAAHPDLDAPNVVNRVVSTARDIGPPGRDDEFGYGAVDPVAALTARVPHVWANPLGSLLAAGEAANPALDAVEQVTEPSEQVQAGVGAMDVLPFHPVVSVGFLVAAMVLIGTSARSGDRRRRETRDVACDAVLEQTSVRTPSGPSAHSQVPAPSWTRGR